MELELKAREYENLCKKLENMKQNIINENDEKLLVIKEEFKRNYEEIIKINKQLKQLKNIEAQKEEEYNYNDLFKKVNNTNKDIKQLQVIRRDNIFKRILNKIKELFNK